MFDDNNILLERWSPQIEAIEKGIGAMDPMKKASIARILQTTNEHFERLNAMAKRNGGYLNEATQVGDTSYFNKMYINVLSAAIPNIIAHDIVSVQPLSARTGEIRYLKLTYGSNKGAIKAGDTMMSSFAGGNSETTYSSSEVSAEAVAAAGTALKGNLAWTPVVPGTIKLQIGNTVLKDNGAGAIVADGTVVATNGTINYATGEFKVTLASATTDDIYFDYSYDNMSSPVSSVPEVNVKIEVAPVIAKSRKLKSLYSFDAAYDLSNDFSMEINAELTKYIASQLKHEIDGEIMNDLLNIAAATSVTWDETVPDGISMRDHNESFYNKIIEASNNIFQATALASGSFIVVGTRVSNIVESVPRFKPSGVTKPIGPHLVGYLGSMPVYKDPYYDPNAFLVGWKGSGFYDAGYIYAPYQPILSTMLIMDAEFQGQRGYATSYAKKPINAKMYCRGTMTKS